MKKYMKKFLVMLTTVVAITTYAQTTITGAGATFPYPIYAKWAEAYKAKTSINMNYQSIGSSGGVKQIKAKTIFFPISWQALSGRLYGLKFYILLI